MGYEVAHLSADRKGSRKRNENGWAASSSSRCSNGIQIHSLGFLLCPPLLTYNVEVQAAFDCNDVASNLPWRCKVRQCFEVKDKNCHLKWLQTGKLRKPADASDTLLSRIWSRRPWPCPDSR